MKKTIKNFCRLIALALAVILTVSLADIVPAIAQDSGFKVVYTLKQLKKAMKSKDAGSIVFRTEVYDSLTIPSVKAAKNKDLYIVAPNVKLKNKSKFNTITVKNVAAYTEAASGNTITWDTGYDDIDLVVDKGKTVKEIVFRHWSGGFPEYVVRKGAKVKNISFVSYDGNLSKADTKKKTVTIFYNGEYDYESSTTTAVYTLDKNGRIIKEKVMYDSDDYDPFTYAYEYDKNGNYINRKCIEGYRDDTVVRTYDSDDKLVKWERIYEDGERYSVRHEFDKKGNLTRVESGWSNDAPYITEYEYDKKGRCVKENIIDLEVDYKLEIEYQYDKAGRLSGEVRTYSDTVIYIEYIYDKNGLLERICNYTDGRLTYLEEKSRDYMGNEVFNVTTNYYEDEAGEYCYRYENYVGEYMGDFPRYEDGFISPVKSGPFDRKEYEKAGYTVVDSAEEFVEAIAPGAKIIIKPGYINLSEYLEDLDDIVFNANHKYVELSRQADGFELRVKDADDLLISGASPNYMTTHIEIDPRYSAVIRFEHCNNLKLNSFTCGHSKTGDCDGNVIDLYNCKNVGIYGMEMYGCGVYGIGAFEGSGNIRVYNTTIHYCEYGIYAFSNLSDTVVFSNCMFFNSNGGGAVWGRNDDTPNLIFKKCSFGKYETSELYFEERNTYIDCMWS